MRSGHRLLTLALFMLCGMGEAQVPSTAEQTVIDLSKRKFVWLTTNHYDSLNSVLDDRLEYIHSNGWVQTKGDVINDSKSGRLNYKKITIKESQARIYGPSAILTGLGTFEGVANGQPFVMDLRYTEVYIKSGNYWKLASRHANRMP